MLSGMQSYASTLVEGLFEYFDVPSWSILVQTCGLLLYIILFFFMMQYNVRVTTTKSRLSFTDWGYIAMVSTCVLLLYVPFLLMAMLSLGTACVVARMSRYIYTSDMFRMFRLCSDIQK